MNSSQCYLTWKIYNYSYITHGKISSCIWKAPYIHEYLEGRNRCLLLKNEQVLNRVKNLEVHRVGYLLEIQDGLKK